MTCKADKRLKLCIIGAGNMAREHLGVFHECEEIEIVGIYSKTLSKARDVSNNFNIPIVANSIKELYDSTKANIVVIAVNELACKEVCLEAVKYNWKLLIEKPVGHNFSEAIFIDKLCTDCGVDAYVGLNRRFYGSTMALQKILRGINGKRVVTVLDQEDAELATLSGRPKKVVDNWMYANSIHLIDYFQQFCRGEHIHTSILSRWNPKDRDPVIAELKFSSGDVGIYHAVWDAPGPWSVTVSTNEVRGELRPLEILSLQFKGSRKTSEVAIDEIDKEYKPGLMRQARELIETFYGNTSELVTVTEATKSMKLVKSIYEQE